MKLKLQIALLAGAWAAIALYQAIGTFFFTNDFYCYRAYECARLRVQPRQGPFRPFFTWDRTSSGDLAHQAGVPALKKYRHQKFSTDEYGFRNPPGVLDRPCDAVLVGDSFAVGSQASDGEIFADLVRDQAGLNIYNYSPFHIGTFRRDERFLDNRPRQIILMYAERNLTPRALYYSEKHILFRPKKFSRDDVLPVARPRPSFKHLSYSRLLAYHAEGLYKGFLYLVGLYEFPETILYYNREAEMFFFWEGGDNHINPEYAIPPMEEAVSAIVKYRDEFKRRESDLLVLIPPDKEAVYHELIPQMKDLNVNVILDRFYDRMEEAHIKHVRLHTVLEAYHAAHPDELLFYPDDTHLTPLAQQVIFDAVKDQLPRPAGAD